MKDSPTRALTELLAQHAKLREIMNRCELLADELDAGHVEAAPVVNEVARLRIAFDAHNRFEEQYLRPVLRETDSFGDVRVDQMVADHVEEHRLMRRALGSSVTAVLRLTIDRLRGHLATEERYFLSSKVLRDDLVVVESTG